MADWRSLAARLVSRAGRGGEDERRLAPLIQQALDDAHRAWPGVALTDELFVDHLATRLKPGEDVGESLSRLKLSDLYLARAAETGRSDAVQAFEDLLLCRVGQFIDKVSRDPAFVAEVTQALRVKLFVGQDGQGKLSQYSGRGALESWVCAVAIRTAYDIGRVQGHEVRQQDDAVDVLAASDDPELDLLRRRYDGQFRGALEAALANLGARERTTLRLYYIERLTAAQIGKLHRVHEVTVLRRVAGARKSVLEWVRNDLSRTLGLSNEEFDDLLTLMRSQLDVSVGRLLETQSDGESARRPEQDDRPKRDDRPE
jgi:RNA polymerase sigma-70 factor (ECF subfamily)